MKKAQRFVIANTKNHSALIFIAALLFAMPREGSMSQSFSEFTSLENLVRGSDVIAVVSKMNPDITMEDVPFDSSGRFPPFRMRHFHFQVMETLYDKSGLKDFKTPIDVADAGEDSRYENEKNTLLKGLPPVSPVYLTYKPGIPYEKLSGPFIVFLRQRGDYLTLAAKSSFESVRNKKQVLRLIKKLSETRPDLSPMPALNLTIKLHQARFVIGDSIPVEVALENSRKSPVEVPDPSIGSEFQYIVTLRKDPHTEYYFSWKRAINERYPLETPAQRQDFPGLQLTPGARQVYHEDLGQFIVNPPPPGEYTLVVEYNGTRSNGESITIVQSAAKE